jgi:hypothetical protein
MLMYTMKAPLTDTHHTPPKTPRNTLRKATPCSRNGGASRSSITRSVTTLWVRALTIADRSRVPTVPLLGRGQEVSDHTLAASGCSLAKYWRG